MTQEDLITQNLNSTETRALLCSIKRVILMYSDMAKLGRSEGDIALSIIEELSLLGQEQLLLVLTLLMAEMIKEKAKRP